MTGAPGRCRGSEKLRGLLPAQRASVLHALGVVFAAAACAACSSVTAVGCAPSAQRHGLEVVVVSAACDTSIAWITPMAP